MTKKREFEMSENIEWSFPGEELLSQFVTERYDQDEISNTLPDWTLHHLRISNRNRAHEDWGFCKKDAAIFANERMRVDNGGLKVPEIDNRRKYKGKYNPSIKPL